MKLQDLEVIITGNPPPHMGGRYFIFVKLTTNDGVIGYGEIYVASFGPMVVKAMAEDMFGRYFQGQDPHHIETLFRRSYSAGYSQRPDLALVGVFSGLEMACWDIIGKAAGKPVYELLGGRTRERLRSYTYLYPKEGSVTRAEEGDRHVYNTPELAAERALEEMALGFSAVKFDPAGVYTAFDGRQPDLPAISRSAAFMRVLRETVGDRCDLLFGTHGQFNPHGAIRLARALEPYDPLWFEEPTPPDNPAAMARVARATSIPVATGERLASKQEFARVLEAGAASILQPDLGRSGGVLETKKIAAMAECYGAEIAPHCYCGPIVAAANIQVAACIPNFLIIESIRDMGGFHAELLKKPILWQDGFIIPSPEPGLGVELNEDVARAHPYHGHALHLEMQDTAV